MIRSNLSTMMGKKKMNIAEVRRRTGLNRSTISGLYKETTQRVDLVAIDKLCNLFDCSISDLLEFVPGVPHPTGGPVNEVEPVCA